MKLIFKCIVIFLLCVPAASRAQEQEQGIRFDKSMSWQEVVEKATRENKYIYVDVMATWCGPCQVMVRNIFTRKEVGDFYNEHFICIKLQTDKTKQDNDYVKAWHKEVNDICTGAKIKVLPTSLYYNSRGELVHLVAGGIPNGERFVEAGKMALDENRQLFSRLKKYEAGEKDVEFLYDLSMDFWELGYKETAARVGNTFWQTITPEERLLEKGIRYANDIFSSPDDAMFSLFMDHSDEVDAVLGKGVANLKVMKAIEAKYVTSLLKDSVNRPDWEAIGRELSGRYPKKQSEIRNMLLERQLSYGKKYQDDALYMSALQELIPHYVSVGNDMLARMYAHQLGKEAQNKEQRALALTWLERTLNEQDAIQLLDYAEILFLHKQKGKGLKQVNAALKLAEEGSSTYEKAVEMKKNNAREMKLLKKVVEEIN